MNPIKLASDTIDRSDINALCEWLQQDPVPRLTMSSFTIAYEEKYSENAGSKYAVFVNSGSSANLLVAYTLMCDGALKNKKIVIPSLAWVTTISPFLQLGLEPILCDVNLQDLSADLNHLEDIFKKEKPCVFFLVSVLGLVPDMVAISELCAKYGVILLLDGCESQGSSLNGRRIETFASMATCSSYAGHNSSTIEGGMITTDNEDYYNLLKMLRSHGWDRNVSEEKRKSLRKQYGATKFNALYKFYHAGFNLRSTEISAFLGLRQLQKLQSFIEARSMNFKLYNQYIINDYWKPTEREGSFTANLGYPIISPHIDEIVEVLRGNQIEIRPLISGNIGVAPFMIDRFGKQEFPNVNKAEEFGCYIPNHQDLTEPQIKFVCDIVNRVINS